MTIIPDAQSIEVPIKYVDGAKLLGVLQARGPLELKEAQDIASPCGAPYRFIVSGSSGNPQLPDLSLFGADRRPTRTVRVSVRKESGW